MKCDLAGLLANAATEIDRLQSLVKDRHRGRADYYAFALREVSLKIDVLRAGCGTVAEFATVYSMTPKEG